MIKIGFDFNKNEILTEDKNIVNEEESLLLSDMYKYLFCDPKDLEITANSKDYTTLQYKNVDIVRIKCTNKAQWIKILISNYDLRNNKENPLFELQANKNESMWKCSLNDIPLLYEYINRSIEMIDSWN